RNSRGCRIGCCCAIPQLAVTVSPPTEQPPIGMDCEGMIAALRAREHDGVLHQIESGLGDEPAASNESQPQLSRTVCSDTKNLRFISNRDSRQDQRGSILSREELCAELGHYGESCRSRHDMRIGLATTQLARVVLPPAPDRTVSPGHQRVRTAL